MAKQKKKKHSMNPNLRFVLKVMLLLFLVTICIIGVLFYFSYGKDIIAMQQEAKQMVQESTVDTFRQTETSLAYDAEGKLLSTLKGVKDVYYISYENIPDYAKEAMIAIEDKKFNTHNGIDLKAIARAFVALVRHNGEVTQGASTITQQLSRNIFLSNEVSWRRKVKEIFIALELEKKYRKYQIMEFYLNNIYFANGYYGIEAASKGYFSKSVSDLDLGQIAFLCAIPNNPTIYDPLENKDNTIKRKNRILKQMLKDGKISEEEYDTAYTEKITLKPPTEKKKNYVETYVYYCATKALMKQQGFTFQYSFNSDKDKENYQKRYEALYNQCQQSLYSSGYRIYTSIDTTKQKELQNSVNDVLSGFTEKSKDGIFKLQGAATCIDNNTGRVVAIVGGRSQDTKGYTLNRAYQSYRQPGSSIKPLIVYTPIFERGCSPNQIVEDKKIKDGPSNSHGTYEGKITIRKAVEKSKNTVAWNLFLDLTPKVGLSYLLDMNFNKIVKNDYYPAAALGGLTNGVSTVEMASAYSTLENDGIFREPTCIVKITDSRGKELVSDKVTKKQVYEMNAARTMTNVLVGVIKNGTGRGLGLSNVISAGKTGTTNATKDGWFVGYTHYYTTSVWVGYDMPKTLNGLEGASYPGRIWHNYMEVIHTGLENVPFPGYVDNSGIPEPTASTTPSPSVSPSASPTVDANVDDTTDGSGNQATPTPTPTPTVSPTNPDPGDPVDDGTDTDPQDTTSPDSGAGTGTTTQGQQATN